jgi:Holliday junction resolvase RusA-like endonuclease
MILYHQVFDLAPVAQERPRSRIVSMKGRKPFIVVYDPKKSKDFKNKLQELLKLYPSVPVLLEEPMILSCALYILRPKSVTREWPEVKPDLGNYVKGVEDAMNGIVYKDDSKIVGYNDCWKRYTDDRPRIEITLRSV